VNMGKEAFTLMLNLIKNKREEYNKPQKIILEPVPVFRDSTDRL